MTTVEADFCEHGAMAVAKAVNEGTVPMRALFEKVRCICTRAQHCETCVATYHHQHIIIPGELVVKILDALYNEKRHSISCASTLLRCTSSGDRPELFFKSLWRYHPAAPHLARLLWPRLNFEGKLAAALIMRRKDLRKPNTVPNSVEDDVCARSLGRYIDWLDGRATIGEEDWRSQIIGASAPCLSKIPAELQSIIFNFLQ